MEAAKSKNLLFAGSVSKKGQAKPALFWVKARKPLDRAGFALVFTG
jgi:hypothetical protein